MAIKPDALNQELPGMERVPNRPPSIEDIELANAIRNLFYRARAARRPLIQEWQKNYRILRNRTWLSTRPTWLPNPEVPEIYPIVSSITGWMTDQRPTLQVIPAAQPHSPYYQFYNQLGDDLQTAMQATWTLNEYEAEIEQVIWDGMTCGAGIFKSGWDHTLSDGMGDAIMRRVDPWTFYPDPNATSMKDANYFMEVRTMSLQELDRRHPGAWELIGSGGAIEDTDDSPTAYDTTSSMPKANPGAISPATAPRYGLPGQGRMSATQATEDMGVTVFEAWIREHETETDDNGNEIVHDGWRVIVMANSHILLNEKATDIWAHGQQPYDRWVPNRTGDFWGGVPMVTLLRPAQLSINRLLAAAQLHIELTGNPVFKESPRAGIQRTKITNKPGQRLTVGEGATAEWLQQPQLSQDIPAMVSFYIGEMERVSGLSAIARGMMPQGRPAQGTIADIQESSFVRIRLGQRNLEWCLRSAGEKIAALICEFYTEPRLVAVVGPSAESSSKALTGRHFYVPTEEGRVPMRFQLLVQAGSSLPTSRGARISEADTLFAMGAIDELALLEVHDWPNAQQVAKRVMELKATGVMQPPGARQRTQRSS